MKSFSLYEGVNNWDTPTKNVMAEEFINLIKDPNNVIASQTQCILKEYHLKGSDEYRDMKKAILMNVAFGLKAGISRSPKILGREYTTEDLTGLFTLDVDQYETEPLKKWFANREFEKLDYIYMVGRSVSGMKDGSMFVVIRISEELYSPALHKKGKKLKEVISRKFRDDTGLTGITQNGVTQARYVSHDPDVFFNPDARAIKEEDIKPYHNLLKEDTTIVKKTNEIKATYGPVPEGSAESVLDWSFNEAIKQGAPGKGQNFSFIQKWIPIAYKCGCELKDILGYAISCIEMDKEELEYKITSFYNTLETCEVKGSLVPSIEDLRNMKYSPPNMIQEAITLKKGEYLNLSVEVFNHNRLMIVAPPGRGKTTAIVNLCESNGYPSILLQPYRNVAEQKGEKFSWHTVFNGLSPNFDPNQVGTFDSIVKYIKSEKLDLQGAYLIIDEAHLMITEYFRKETLERLYWAFDNFMGVILLTATYIESNLFDGFEIKKYEEEGRTIPYTLVQADNPNVAIFDLLEPNSLNFILLDNKEQNERNAQILRMDGFVVETLSADKDNTPFYHQIKTEGIIPENVQVIFSTRIISHAVDLYAPGRKINYIICPQKIGNAPQPAYQVAQFCHRFRENEEFDVNLILKKKTYLLGTVFDLKKLYNQIQTRTEKKQVELNSILDNLQKILGPERFEDFLRKYIKVSLPLSYNEDWNMVNISALGLAQEVYKTTEHIIGRNIILYLNELASYGFVHQEIILHDRQQSDTVRKLEEVLKKQRQAEKEEVYHNEVSEAYEKHKIFQDIPETEGGRRFLELFSILDNRCWVKNILFSTHRKDYAKVLLQAKNFMGKNSNPLCAKVYASFQKGWIYSTQEMFELIEEIREDLVSTGLSILVADFPMGEKGVKRYLNQFFRFEKSCSRHKKNCYKVVSNNPLGEYLPKFKEKAQ